VKHENSSSIYTRTARLHAALVLVYSLAMMMVVVAALLLAGEPVALTAFTAFALPPFVSPPLRILC